MNLIADLCRIGPAPTLAREVPVLVVSLLVVAAVATYAVNAGHTALLVASGVLVVYAVGRLGYRIARPVTDAASSHPR